MLNWLNSNWGNILVGGMLLAVITGIIIYLIRRYRSGKCPGCSGNCAHCHQVRDGAPADGANSK